MAPILPYLVTQAASGLSAFRGGQQQRHQQDLEAAMTRFKLEQSLKEQAVKDALAKAQTFRAQAAGEKDQRGAPGRIVYSQDGTAYIQGADGSLSPATVHAGVPPTPLAPPPSDEIDLDKPQTPVELGMPPLAGSRERPRFGPRAPLPRVERLDQVMQREIADRIAKGESPEAANAAVRTLHGQQNQQPPLPQIVSAQTPTGDPRIFTVDKRTNQATEVGGIKPNPTSQGRGAVTLQQKIAGNQVQLDKIATVLKEVAARPSTVGLTRVFGDAVNQRIDPGGIGTRADLANIGSLVIHDRSGAAVTVSEFQRLKPLIPRETDSPEKIRQSLERLAAGIALETRLLQKNIANGTVKESNVQPLQQGGGKAGGQTITVNGKTFKVPE